MSQQTKGRKPLLPWRSDASDSRYLYRGARKNLAALLATVEQSSQVLLAPLQGIPGVKAEMLTNIIGHQPFGVQLEVDPDVTGITAQELVDKLKQGDPPIWTRVREDEDWITLHAFGLNDGEDKIVGERIAALLKN